MRIKDAHFSFDPSKEQRLLGQVTLPLSSTILEAETVNSGNDVSWSHVSMRLIYLDAEIYKEGQRTIKIWAFKINDAIAGPDMHYLCSLGDFRIFWQC